MLLRSRTGIAALRCRRGVVGSVAACVADDDVRRDGVGLDHDDRRWRRSPCPGTGAPHRAFADTDGPLLYRHRFHLDTPADGRRRFVMLDGVFYQADVWLDGAYLGDPEGYFFPHTFDITDLVPARRRARARHRGVVLAAAAAHGEAQHHRRRSSTGTCSTPTGTPAACGARCASTTPAPCASTACGCCAATPTTPAPTCACTPASTPTRQRTVRACAPSVDGDGAGRAGTLAGRRA